MRRILHTFLLLLALPLGSRAEPRQLVVTTTLIETAVRDLLGEAATIARLLPPGSCPGHFDLEPRQATALGRAKLVIRHDYQAGMDERLIQTGVPSNRIVSLTSHPSFAIPGAYLALCAELAERLAGCWPEQAPALQEQLAAVRAQGAAAELELAERLRPLRGRKVLAARYQKDYCVWAGLEVVAVFQAGTDESAWQLSRAVDMARTAGAQAVIGNRQWGDRHLAALTEATGLPGVLLSNFPHQGGRGAYWIFVEENVQALLTGLP